MARFDVFQGATGRGYLLDSQSDVVDVLDTRVVIPLMPAKGLPIITRLNPIFEIEGQQYVLSTHLIFAIPTERLGTKILNLSNEDLIITEAIDLLMTGH